MAEHTALTNERSIMRTLPIPAKQTTLQVIASEGIIDVKSRRINGGGYNNILITTKEATYLVNPSTTLVLEMHTDRVVTILEEHGTVVNSIDCSFFERVESSIHDEEQSHWARTMDITVPQGRPLQLISLEKEQGNNMNSIRQALKFRLKNSTSPICKIHGVGHIDEYCTNNFVICVNEMVEGKEIEYEYTYDLLTTELTKEEL